ncbi:NAD(P)H-dependent glycerol-3-phosphate dehydrogenase [Pelagicoccus sp. SDUM812005]|uniref:NAD(P)H-dependent glycerol-3-phosphate dehydrogenase n=1 Tax=Pelagicoccus sp. SDUM812005 TaxID=3041257 RepID=UPI00280DCC83|nr:NAD(P)H-dependent glycerol-3-phosphate dehydrogenase [Pelagicoccus sp. SDUM812005]MDQ8181450.1 NAD(P)-dependent glycerol-3-phosphate dehydrogenase [Pelagicoccus sp. SDUM812005]
MSEPLKITVCGAGAWGTSVALHCERQGLPTTLMARRPEQAAAMEAERENKDYLPGYAFGASLRVTADLATALRGADVVFLGAPSYALRAWCQQIAALEEGVLKQGALFVSLAKGLELETRQTPCGIVKEELPGAIVGSLSGPTFAGEVAAGKPTAMTLAFDDCGEAAMERLQNAISGPNLRVYASHDLKGVELGGCLKNVYAIAAGCCQGLKLGDNALASLLTRAVAEMVRVGQALGAKLETFYGLSGFGDLVATCHGEWSRNRTFGEAIAGGRTAAEIIAQQKTAVEGYRTAKAFHQECRSKGIDAPILEQVYKICYESKPPMQALGDLMSRDLKKE